MDTEDGADWPTVQVVEKAGGRIWWMPWRRRPPQDSFRIYYSTDHASGVTPLMAVSSSINGPWTVVPPAS